MKRTKKKPGRPKIPDKKIPVSVRLSPDVVKFLKFFGNRAKVIDALVRSTVGFEIWRDGKK